eukprot:CAMPEP_0198722972 /NCGR_PEP_ID=MMETSP1475-20131203/549_1 /TAXON_ID= ORGANISM="Unidentified sp., Strain CCMP1999" /NCGR_SAMPLE_ID=MMETSP1475 /ASSEMBLY_ACC=CAM_ASM_001111 /LENGTH=166 /DNA_ID=CAMNT_0044483937 /DNA_START=47 /DNA_END=547 /DNA_ORIENTATION=-
MSAPVSVTARSPSAAQQKQLRRIPISQLLCEEPQELERGSSGQSCASDDGSQKTSDCQRKRIQRPRWKKWEDELLMQIISKRGPGSWRRLAEEFPGRTGRQVRLRWMNHLSPEIDKRPWTTAEDEALLTYQMRYGNTWSRIAKAFPGRSDNSVKNRFNQINRARKP